MSNDKQPDYIKDRGYRHCLCQYQRYGLMYTLAEFASISCY